MEGRKDLFYGRSTSTVTNLHQGELNEKEKKKGMKTNDKKRIISDTGAWHKQHNKLFLPSTPTWDPGIWGRCWRYVTALPHLLLHGVDIIYAQQRNLCSTV